MSFPLCKFPNQVGLHGEAPALCMASANKKIKPEFDSKNAAAEFLRFIVLFGRDLPSQIIFFLNREAYFKQRNFSDCQKAKKWKFACGGGQSEECWKYNQNEDVLKCKAYPQKKLKGAGICPWLHQKKQEPPPPR